MSGNRENFCEVCNQNFERPTGLISHKKSKKHLIKTNNLNNSNSRKCPNCKKTIFK